MLSSWVLGGYWSLDDASVVTCNVAVTYPRLRSIARATRVKHALQELRCSVSWSFIGRTLQFNRGAWLIALRFRFAAMFAVA